MYIDELNVILEKHRKWLMDEGGERADLSKANLSGVNLFKVNLSGVNLVGANLVGANLAKANLVGAILTEANLCGAILAGADLYGVNLTGVNLSNASLNGANLCGAILTDANLYGANLANTNLAGADLTGVRNIDMVNWTERTAFYNLACPEEGAFIGWKKADNFIIKLRITEDAKRSSATSRKCRCSKADVLEIQAIDGSISATQSVPSNRDPSFLYTVGKTVEVPDFDEDRWNECSTGIHFFITRAEAVNY